MLTRAMRKQNLPLQRLMTHDALSAVAEDFHYVDISGLYAGVGDGHTSAQSVMEKLVEHLGGHETPDEDLDEVSIPTQVAKSKFSDSGVIVRGVGDVWVKLARCCTLCPLTPSLDLSPAVLGCRSIGLIAPTSPGCATSRTGSSRSSGHQRSPVSSRGDSGGSLG